MKLLPCPLCNKEVFYSLSKHSDNVCIRCNNCDLTAERNLDIADNSSELMNRWNKRTSPWISVKDKLPKENCLEVIVLTDCFDIDIAYYRKYYFDEYSRKIINFHFKSDHTSGEVTHWMPLPKLPEEKP